MAEVTIYLEGWQKRMVRDFTKLKPGRINTVTIKPGKGSCLASYRIPANGFSKDDWLIYLTDEQMLQVKEQLRLRTPVASINVTPAAIKAGELAFG